MDYNDIELRLSRTLQALNQRFNKNLSENIVIEKKQDVKSLEVNADFGRDNTYEILNKIFIILYNLSSLKDHIKNHFKKDGINPNIVEDTINNSVHLQVLIDIVNQDKHGYPLSKTNRSNLNPKIDKPKQSLMLSTGDSETGSAAFKLNPDGSYSVSGNAAIAIYAKITDGMGNILFNLDELVETCYSAWGKLLNNNGYNYTP